ncbi:hypothetical protein J0H58_02370 [bacterium]|nr:hypothetical protein [bacterium]
MDYERIRAVFTRSFPTGEFTSCDFRPHIDGHGHNAWVGILPAESLAETRRLAYNWLAEMVDALRPLRPLFGPQDRIQLAVGFPQSVRAINCQILKGWFPTLRLVDVEPPDFAAVGGEFGENDAWHVGLWER